MPLWQLREYLTADGVSPFSKWRDTLSAQMRARLDRVLERFAGGTKQAQSRDIRDAKERWKDYKRRK